jgi:hypothetical protein
MENVIGTGDWPLAREDVSAADHCGTLLCESGVPGKSWAKRLVFTTNSQGWWAWIVGMCVMYLVLFFPFG